MGFSWAIRFGPILASLSWDWSSLNPSAVVFSRERSASGLSPAAWRSVSPAGETAGEGGGAGSGSRSDKQRGAQEPGGFDVQGLGAGPERLPVQRQGARPSPGTLLAAAAIDVHMRSPDALRGQPAGMRLDFSGSENSGGGGIRTHGPLRVAGFQDRYDPLR